MLKGNQAKARSHTYELLGKLFHNGLTADLLPYLQSIADAFAGPQPVSVTADEDDDARAAVYQHLFGFNVFPYESVFLDTQGILGGPVAEAVLQFCKQSGYSNGMRSSLPDHLSMELGLLAFLSGAEADAWEDGQANEAQRMRTRQREFLDQHLLRWLPLLVQAVQQQTEPLFSSVAELTLDVVLDHRRSLVEDPTGVPGSSRQVPTSLPRQFALSPETLSLEQGGTGLKHIASYLLTPARCALFLSRDDINRLGQRHRLPRGFGDRKVMLGNLLRSAVEYDGLPALLADLQSLAGAWGERYRALAESDLESMTAIGQVWGTRLANTIAMLDQLRSASLDLESS